MDVKVESLLANIRKAVDDDLDQLGNSTAGEARGTLMRGALREMRVQVTGERTPAQQEEINDLRERIKRKVEEQTKLPVPQIAAPGPADAGVSAAAATAKRGDFRGIMGGPVAAPPAGPRPALPLRPTLADVQHDDELEYRAAALAEQAYAEQAFAEPPYHANWQQQPPQDVYGAGYSHPDAYGHDGYRQPQHPHYPVAQVPAPIMSAHAEAAAETAFRQLSDSLLSRATGDRSIEDVTRELLRGMLKQWLDANLPTLVEELVREEIERVARRGR